MLVEQLRLEAVVKLPHWVFKPYASVDTSILIFSKGGKTDEVWFYRIENDGYADDAQKSPVANSELPEVLNLWRNPGKRTNSENRRKHRMVPIDEIRGNGYDLCPAMYLSGHRYPEDAEVVKLGSLFDIVRGTAAATSAVDEGKFPFFTTSIEPRRSDVAPFLGPAICIPTVSATGHGHASIKAIHLAENRFDASSITAVLLPKSKEVPTEEIYFYLLAHKEDLLVPMMRGATNKSLNPDRLGDLHVPILKKGSAQGRKMGVLLQQKQKLLAAEGELKALRAQHNESIEQLRNFDLLDV
jgi:type I restriction-modification system DNA methylase subunit